MFAETYGLSDERKPSELLENDFIKTTTSFDPSIERLLFGSYGEMHDWFYLGKGKSDILYLQGKMGNPALTDDAMLLRIFAKQGSQVRSPNSKTICNRIIRTLKTQVERSEIELFSVLEHPEIKGDALLMMRVRRMALAYATPELVREGTKRTISFFKDMFPDYFAALEAKKEESRKPKCETPKPPKPALKPIQLSGLHKKIARMESVLESAEQISADLNALVKENESTSERLKEKNTASLEEYNEIAGMIAEDISAIHDMTRSFGKKFARSGMSREDASNAQINVDAITAQPQSPTILTFDKIAQNISSDKKPKGDDQAREILVRFSRVTGAIDNLLKEDSSEASDLRDQLTSVKEELGLRKTAFHDANKSIKFQNAFASVMAEKNQEQEVFIESLSKQRAALERAITIVSPVVA
ncbi:MAG: hypothetical protein AAF988_07340 [Pseudomonadota bacterium]